MEKCLNAQFKKKIKCFSEQWDNLTFLLCQFKKNNKYEKIKFDVLINIMENCRVFDLLVLNLQYDNYVALFFKYLRELIINENDGEITMMIQNLTQSIPKTAVVVGEALIYKTIEKVTNTGTMEAVKNVIEAVKMTVEAQNKVVKQ